MDRYQLFFVSSILISSRLVINNDEFCYYELPGRLETTAVAIAGGVSASFSDATLRMASVSTSNFSCKINLQLNLQLIKSTNFVNFQEKNFFWRLRSLFLMYSEILNDGNGIARKTI